MKIGHFVIEYYNELLIPKDKFTLLNSNSVKWYPSLNFEKANEGWVWFDSKKEYKKTKKIIKEKLS